LPGPQSADSCHRAALNDHRIGAEGSVDATAGTPETTQCGGIDFYQLFWWHLILRNYPREEVDVSFDVVVAYFDFTYLHSVSTGRGG
jgi:hypothetical protein